MISRPLLFGGTELVAWRLDTEKHSTAWDSGIGAELAGGRWNSAGVKVVYCALDPATAICEIAVHKGFGTLDMVPHTLTSLSIKNPKDVFVVEPSNVSNPNWLRPGIVSAGQQKFGDDLLAKHRFVAIPSAVSTYSWNLLFRPSVASGFYSLRSQERFALDTRLHPAKKP